MLVLAVVISIIMGLSRGGRLCGLAELNLKGWPCYVLAGLIQFLVSSDSVPAVKTQGPTLYAISFVILLFGSLLDIGMKGLKLVALGVSMNGLAVAANHGKMPVMAPSGVVLADAVQALTHAPMDQSTKFRFLGDLIKLPLPQSHFLLLSLGDLLIAVGVFVVVQQAMLRIRAD